MGSARGEDNRSGTEDIENETAMFSIHPMQPTEATERRMAVGAAFAAPDVSSDICAAESSRDHGKDQRKTVHGRRLALTSGELPHWRNEC